MIDKLAHLGSWALDWPGTPVLLAWSLALGLAASRSRLAVVAAAAAVLGCGPLATTPPRLRLLVGAALAVLLGWLAAREILRRFAERPRAASAALAAAGAVLLLASWLAGGVGVTSHRGGLVDELTWLLAWPGGGLVAATALSVFVLLEPRRDSPRSSGTSLAALGLLAGACVLLLVEGRARILEASAAAAAAAGAAASVGVLRLPPGVARALVPCLAALVVAWSWVGSASWGSGAYIHPVGLGFATPQARAEVLHRGVALASAVAPAAEDRVYFSEFTTGRIGRLELVDGSWELGTLVELELGHEPPGDRRASESGLWGLAVAPGGDWLYAMASAPSPEGVGRAGSRVVRVALDGTEPARVDPVIEDLPGGPIHNGGALAFGPDGMLYVSIGDGGLEPGEGLAASPLAGTILRLQPDGSVPADNPVVGSPVFARGFRNIYGLAFDPSSGALYATENGPSCCDRLLRVLPGGDHGWPRYGGDPRDPERMASDPSVVAPLFDSGPSRIGPTGLAVRPSAGGGSELFFGTWHTAALHRVLLDAEGELVAHEIVLDAGLARGPSDSVYPFAGGFSSLALDPGGGIWFASLDAIGVLGGTR